MSEVTEEAAYDDLMARLKRRVLIAMLLAGSPFLLLGVVIGQPAAAFGGHKIWVMAGLAALGLLAFGANIVWARRLPRAQLRQVALRRIDLAQRQRSISLLMFGALSLAQTPYIWRSAGELIAGEGDALSYIFLGCGLGISLVTASLLVSQLDRKANAPFDDEFSRALCIRALLVGFAALALGVIGLFILGVSHPLWAVQALPLVLLYAVVIAGCTYAILDLRAGKGE